MRRRLMTRGETKFLRFSYPSMVKTQGDFRLTVEAGDFTDTEIIVLLGENGTGKTTFIRLIAGLIKPDDEEMEDLPEFNVSYKPQKISPKFESTVRDLLHKKIRDAYLHPQFPVRRVEAHEHRAALRQRGEEPLGRRVAEGRAHVCMGQPADLYLIDEPSAYLDSEQRIWASKVIKRFIIHSKKTAFIVEHDFIMATYLADRVVVYSGEPAVEATAPRAVRFAGGHERVFEAPGDHVQAGSVQLPNPRINKMDSVGTRSKSRRGNFTTWTTSRVGGAVGGICTGGGPCTSVAVTREEDGRARTIDDDLRVASSL